MFALKKLLEAIAMPYSLGLLFVLVGLGALQFSRRQRVGRMSVAVGSVVLLMGGCEPLAGRLIGMVESGYPPLTNVDSLSGVSWVVVLGGGNSSDESLPLADRLSEAATARIEEGVRLQRALRGSRLLLSGGGEPIPHARLLAAAAAAMGVADSSMTLEQRPLDTSQEARLITKRLRGERFILVTSASHMQRALQLFRAYGAEPIPAPTDFTRHEDPEYPGYVFPKAEGLGETEIAVHELLGRAWATLVLTLAPPDPS